MSDIELSKYIQALREEISQSINSGDGSDLRFFNDKIELELEVEIAKHVDTKGEVKFRFFVFDGNVGAGASAEVKRTQKLTMALIPAYKDTKSGIWISGTGTKLTG